MQDAGCGGFCGKCLQFDFMKIYFGANSLHVDKYLKKCVNQSNLVTSHPHHHPQPSSQWSYIILVFATPFIESAL